MASVLALYACGGGGSGAAPPGPPSAPTVSLVADPQAVYSGSSSILTWSSPDATSCTASGGWSGTKAASGSESTGPLTSSSSYGITCSNAAGSASASGSVTIIAGSMPALVQSVSSSNTRNSPLAAPFCYHFQLPNPATAGNAIVVGFTSQGDPAPSVADDQGDTYQMAARYYDSANDQSIGIAAAFDVKAGARVISLCFSSNPGGGVQPMATEFDNLVGIDGTGSGTGGSGSAVTAAPLAPTAAGDLVYQVTASLSRPQASVTAGAQANVGWNLLSADLLDGWAGQFGIYGSSGALSPVMSLGTPARWVTAAALFRTGAAGQVPSGLRIVHLLHENIPYHTAAGGTGDPFANPVSAQFPCSGNLLVAMIGGGNGVETASEITDSHDNPWQEVGAAEHIQGDASVQTFYAASPNCSSGLALSVTFGGNAGDYTMLLYDLASAAPSPLDTSVAGGGDYQTAGTLDTGLVLTPTTSDEIVFAEVMWDWNTATGLVGGLSDTNLFDGESVSGPEPVDENNGWGHVMVNGPGSIDFKWQVLSDSIAVGNWTASAVAFKGQ